MIENLVEQKKDRDRDVAIWEAAQKKKQSKQNTIQKDDLEKIKANFIEGTYAVPLAKERDKYERIQREEEKDKRRIIDALNEHKTDPETKQSWIKTSFWAPEMTPSAETAIGKKPDQRLKCPSHAGVDHYMRLKDATTLKIDEGEKGEYYYK